MKEDTKMIRTQAFPGDAPSLVGEAVIEMDNYTMLLSAQLFILRPTTGLKAPTR